MSVRRDVAFRTGKKGKIKKESKEKQRQKEYVYKTEEKDKTALETFSGDQFTLSTSVDKTKLSCWTPPPPPHHRRSTTVSLHLYPYTQNKRIFDFGIMSIFRGWYERNILGAGVCGHELLQQDLITWRLTRRAYCFRFRLLGNVT